jgi:hypothetical protein
VAFIPATCLNLTQSAAGPIAGRRDRYSRIALQSLATRVMDVVTAVITAKGDQTMNVR